MAITRYPPTKIVIPFDLLAAEPAEDDTAADDELDYCFEDAELTRQLRAVKSGRQLPIAMIVGSVLALVTAMLLFT